MLPVRRVEQLKVGKSIHNAVDSGIERSASPDLFTNLGAVFKIGYKDAQTDKCEYCDTEHHFPVTLSRNRKCRADEHDRSRAITQKPSSDKHHYRKDQERTDPNQNPFAISALKCTLQAEQNTEHPNRPTLLPHS